MTDEIRNRLQHALDHAARNGSALESHVVVLKSDIRALLAAGASEGQAVGEIREIDGFTQVVLKAKAKLPDRTKLYTHPSAEIAALRERIAILEHERDEAIAAEEKIQELHDALFERIAGMEKEQYREAGVWEPDGKKFMTYRNENLNGKAMYVKEPK